jgi:Uma2 family endonuclease
MSTTFIINPELSSTVSVASLPRKRWTRREVAILDEHHIFDGQRYELIEGELFSRMGVNRPHSVSITLVSNLLATVFGGEFVQSQVPIDVAPADNPSSEPEPDAFVLNRNIREIANVNPQPADLALVVEVADTSLALDLTTKAALYARAAIADYWVLDINARRLIVLRDPRDGAYQSLIAYEGTESIAPLARPDAVIEISKLLP